MVVDQDDPPSSTKAAAIAYVRCGWSVIPVPLQSKNPGFKGWEQLRITADSVGAHFNGHPQNIGVLLGEPSGWLIDVDLDHPRAVTLAPEYLPPTTAIFGRPGNPRSHWLYRVMGPIRTKQFPSKSAGMLVELRSTGLQTIVPPSTHESGEPITWDHPDPEPAPIDPHELLQCVTRLAEAVLVELGEKAQPKSKRVRQVETAAPPMSLTDTLEIRAARCLTALQRMNVVEHQDGSRRLYCCACRTVEYDLDPTTALRVIRQHARERPFVRDWSDDEILVRIRDAEKSVARGQALAIDGQGLVALGSRDPQTGRLVLSTKRTLPTAEAYLRDFHAHPDGRTIHAYAGMLVEWADNRYRELEDDAVRQQLQAWLHEALRYVCNRRTNELELVDFESNPATVNAALESIRARCHLRTSTPCPSWLNESSSNPPPAEILACRSQLLHLPTMRRIEPTPAYFVMSALDFDPVPQAPAPMEWFEFLHQLFMGDHESLDLLQEWFGYCLTADTSLQKMLLIVGPRRSGKGTLARVLSRLVGLGNVAGPTTSSLAGTFGLQPLIGKTLAIVSDARFSGEHIATVVERLLCISGDDTLTIDRKFLGSVTLKDPRNNNLSKFVLLRMAY